MVANEWNELQTLRKTRISLQVVMVVFLMKVRSRGAEQLSGLCRWLAWRTWPQPTPTTDCGPRRDSTWQRPATSAGKLSPPHPNLKSSNFVAS